MCFVCISYTQSLLPISEFVLDEMFQQNASKFARFYIYQNPKLLSPFFISCNFMFLPNECPGLCQHMEKRCNYIAPLTLIQHFCIFHSSKSGTYVIHSYLVLHNFLCAMDPYIFCCCNNENLEWLLSQASISMRSKQQTYLAKTPALD